MKIGGGIIKYNFILIATFLLFLIPSKSLAADISLNLVSNKTEIIVGDSFDVALNINTGGQSINGLQFGVEFSNDIIEGLQPNPAGSLFPMVAQSSPTSYVAGAFGTGANGAGSVTTLRFKAKTVGSTVINVTNFNARGGEKADLLGLIPSTSLEVIVKEKATEKPVVPTNTQTATKTPTVSTPQSTTPQVDIATPSQSEGSSQEVIGQIGSQPEDAIKQQEEVKGTSSNTDLLKYSLIPTILLLLLVVWLGIKLYFTERKRHFELEKAFENELSTISALESKMDMLSVKDEDAKNQYMDEFEKAKQQIKRGTGN